jgi:hypothetical protein
VRKGLGEAVVHAPQDFRRVLRGDDESGLVHPGKFLAAEVEGFLAEVEALALISARTAGLAPANSSLSS